MTIAGKRILLVEDEVLIALDAEDILVGAGYEVVGPANTLDGALTMAAREVLDAAVLDVNLGGTYVWPVAEALVARRIPFLLLTGFGAGLDVPPVLEAIPRLGKPVPADALLRAISVLLAR